MRDTVDADIGRVHARQHQMSRLRRRQRDPHRLGIAHLADDDDVGRLAQRGAQRGREVGRVDADLHLLDQALTVHVLVLDRILDGDDVPRLAAVDLLDQRRQRRRLARAGRAADEHEAARQARELLDAGRQVAATRAAAPRVGSARIAAAGRPRS